MTWDKSDKARFREYLQKSGSKIFSYLNSRIPKTNGKTIEQVALQARFKEGYESALHDLRDLIQEDDESSDASSGNFTTM